jgi:O-antigen/teichoic acid export membrane protein
MTMPAAVQEKESVSKEIGTAVRHSAVYGLGSVLIKVLSFFMLPFYTYYLSPSDYGTLEILDLSMSLFGMFLNMGMTAALLRSYAAAPSEGEQRKVVSTGFLFTIVTGLITFFVGLHWVTPASIALLGPATPSKYLLMSFGSFILGYIANLPRTYLLARQASGPFVLVDTTAAVLMLLLNIYFIAILKIGLMSILLSSLLVAAGQLLVLSVWTLRNVGIRFSGPLLRQMVAFGLPLVFSNLALFALNFSDRFFLQRLCSLSVVGIYAVGYKFGFMLNYLLVQPFYVMWQSRMFLVHAQPSHRTIFAQIFVLFSIVLTYAALALSMLSPEIVHFMVGNKYADSQEVIPIVAASYVFCGIGYFVQLGMFVTSRTNLIGVVSAVAAVLNLVLNYWLILHYGMIGAAWATLLSFFAIAAGSYCCSQRIYPLPLEAGRVAKAMILAVGLYFASRWFNWQSIGVLLVKGAILTMFPVLLWKARILSQAEIGTLASTRDNIVARISRLIGIAGKKAASI